MKTCLYCYEWINSNIIKISGTKKNIKATRLCKMINKEIKSDSETCNKFHPCSSFVCEKFDFRITPLICTGRYFKTLHGNKEQKKLYSDCSKCKQLKKIILPICNEFVECLPPPIIHLKRRDKTILKRRKK